MIIIIWGWLDRVFLHHLFLSFGLFGCLSSGFPSLWGQFLGVCNFSGLWSELARRASFVSPFRIWDFIFSTDGYPSMSRLSENWSHRSRRVLSEFRFFTIVKDHNYGDWLFQRAMLLVDERNCLSRIQIVEYRISWAGCLCEIFVSKWQVEGQWGCFHSEHERMWILKPLASVPTKFVYPTVTTIWWSFSVMELSNS